jgi:hypothetical protein
MNRTQMKKAVRTRHHFDMPIVPTTFDRGDAWMRHRERLRIGYQTVLSRAPGAIEVRHAGKTLATLSRWATE